MKTVLINPFEKYASTQLLVGGLLMLLAGSYLGFVFHARFDGVIDLHFTEKILWYQPLIDNLINTACLFLLLFMLGNYINKKTRAIDILNPVLIGRVPLYLLTFFNIDGYMTRMTQSILEQVDIENLGAGIRWETGDIIAIVLFSCIALAFLVWFVLLLYNGFRVATNTKGGKNIALFAAALVVAEIVSKIVITYSN